MEHQNLGVYAETYPREARVALVPATVPYVLGLGVSTLIESSAGERSGISDTDYLDAGATIVTRAELFAKADILVGVRPPNVALDHRFRAGQALICLLEPMRIPDLVWHWANQGLTAVAVDLLPAALRRINPLYAPATAYAETVMIVLRRLLRDGALTLDLTDTLQSTIVVAHRREVLNDAVWRVILNRMTLAGLP